MIHPATALPLIVSAVALLIFAGVIVALVVEHRRSRREEAEYQELMDAITDFRRDFDND